MCEAEAGSQEVRCPAGERSRNPPKREQASDTSPWTCATLTAFTGTSGRRQVLFSPFLPIRLSLLSPTIPTHTHVPGLPAPARSDTQGRKNMKRNQFKRANLSIFKHEVYFYSLQLVLLRVCGSNQETRGEREREIMFTDSNVTKPAG